MIFTNDFYETPNYFGLNDLNRALTQWNKSKGKRIYPSLMRMGRLECDNLAILATSGYTSPCSSDGREMFGIKIDRLNVDSHLEFID